MESRLSFWGRSGLAAVAYGLVYAVLREITLSGISAINWIPMAGLRFICLLLVPACYWPALMVGEAIPLGYQNYQCLELFGLPWVVVTSIPAMLYTAPIVHVLRKRWPHFEKNLAQQVGPLLLCMFLVALATALNGALSYSLLKQLAPGESPIPLWLYGSRLLTSGYLSLLTVTPAVLWIASCLGAATAQRRWPSRLLTRLVRDPRWRGTAALLAMAMGLAATGYKWGTAVPVLTLAGILAVLTLAAWRYGWQSTAMVGAAANLGVIALMPTHDDLLTIQLQCMIAVAMSSLLLFGARTTASEGLARDLRQAEQQARLAEDQARQAEQTAAATRETARQEIFSHERHRLAYAAKLEQVFDQTRQEAIRVLHDVRPVLPSSAIAKHYQEFDELQQAHGRLTNALSPPAWLQLGGPNGPLARALERLGARCNIDIPSLSDLTRLSTEFSIALYRLSCEAVAYLIKHVPSDDVRIALAVLRREEGQHPIVEMTFDSLGKTLTVESAAYASFLLDIGAIGLNKRALQRRAQLYEGCMEVKHLADWHLHLRLQATDPIVPPKTCGGEA